MSSKDELERPPLRLVKTQEAKRPEAGPEPKAVLDGMRRRRRVKGGRGWRDTGCKDVA